VKIKPRKWQKEALDLWAKEYRGILKVVTGGGKTILAILALRLFLDKNPNKQVLILVPSVSLLDQWFLELEKFLGKEVEIGIYGGGFKAKKSSQIILTTMDSAKKALNLIRNTEKCFLIVDECHRVGAEKRSIPIQNKWMATLGLSATPEREYDKALNEIIIPYIGPIIYEYNYLDAHKDGVISDFNLVNVYAPMDTEEELEYEEISRKIGRRIGVLGKLDPTDNALKMLLINRARLVNSTFLRVPAVLRILKQKEKGKWLIFTESIEQATLIDSLISDKGYRSNLYHSGLDPTTRRTNLYHFKKNILDILVSCRSLDEGFDVPDADSAIIVSSSAASRQRIQRMGRVLRKSSKKEKASIYTIFSSEHEKERLAEEHERLIDNVKIEWYSLKSNKL
jgi:superfamily II DNA or RNA helicase